MSEQNDLRIIGLLGSGQFASVWRVDSGNSTTEYALKRCCKRIAAREQKGIENLLEEKRVHDMLNHAMIVRSFTFFRRASLPDTRLTTCSSRLASALIDSGRGNVQLSFGAV